MRVEQIHKGDASGVFAGCGLWNNAANMNGCTSEQSKAQKSHAARMTASAAAPDAHANAQSTLHDGAGSSGQMWALQDCCVQPPSQQMCPSQLASCNDVLQQLLFQLVTTGQSD